MSTVRYAFSLVLLGLVLLCGTAGYCDSIQADLQPALQQANKQGKLLLVDFYGAWCPWCVKMDDTLADSGVKAVLDKSFYYYKLDVGHFDQHTDCLKYYGVDGIPFIAVFRSDGSKLSTSDGYLAPADFTAFLNKAVASNHPTTIHPDLKPALNKANANGKLLLVDFYGGWCPWCVKMDDTLKDPAVKALLDSNYYYYKLDVGKFDKHTNCLEQYQVDGIPFILVFNADGSIRATQDGYAPVADFTTFLKDNLKAKGMTAYQLDNFTGDDPVSQAVKKAAEASKQLVVYFYADGAGNTDVEKAITQANGSAVSDKFAILRVKQQDHAGLAAHYGCNSTPFLIVFKPNGDTSSFFTEVMTGTDLIAKMKGALP